MYKSVSLVLLLTAALIFNSCSEEESDDGNNPPAFTPAGMVKITAKNQAFSMGSVDGAADEQPVHTVNFSRDFWMDTTEVTQSKYSSVMSAAYSAYTDPTWNEPYGQGSNIPAFNVYWGDAVLYCNALSRRDGRDSVYTYTAINGTPGNGCALEGVTSDITKNGYRLPTEAEWEFACRGGIAHDYYWGSDYDPYPETPADSADVDARAVWMNNSYVFGSDVDAYGIHSVAGKPANPFGLYDMAGNVYEWCHDWYGEYAAGTVTDPTGPATGGFHLLRGGSWGSHATHLRTANRTFSVPDYEYYFIGFRVVVPVE